MDDDGLEIFDDLILLVIDESGEMQSNHEWGGDIIEED